MNDDLTTRLTRQLHDEADGWHGAPLTLESVRGRAHAIRRTRRMAAAGAAALAVAAIAVPTALLGTGVQRSTPDPIQQPDAPVARTTLTLDGLARGAAPGVEYFTRDGVVLPGQGTRELPYNYNALVPSQADGGWVAWEGASLDVRYLDQDLQPHGGSASNSTFVSNPDRTVVAWVSPESGAQTLVRHSTVDADDTQVWDFPDASAGVVEAVDFVADDRIVVTTTERSGKVDIAIAEPDGSTSTLDGYVDAVSASTATGLVAVQSDRLKDGSGCFGVVDPAAADTPLWETCNHSLGAFSPDGRYVLASDPYLSGAGIASIAVLDAATGDEVASFDPERGQQFLLQRVVWESDDAFLATASQGNEITMLRFGVDGTLEEVTDRVEGDAFGDVPYYLGSDGVRGF
jgi:hypothetical protein